MNPLDELLTLPPSMRRLRLGHGDTRDALVGLGREAAIAWLEEQIESPIGPEWGRLLFAVKPEWAHLDHWIRHFFLNHQ